MKNPGCNVMYNDEILSNGNDVQSQNGQNSNNAGVVILLNFKTIQDLGIENSVVFS